MAVLRRAESFSILLQCPLLRGPGLAQPPESDCTFPQHQGSSNYDSRRQAQLRSSFALQPTMGGLCYGGLPDQSLPPLLSCSQSAVVHGVSSSICCCSFFLWRACGSLYRSFPGHPVKKALRGSGGRLFHCLHSWEVVSTRKSKKHCPTWLQLELDNLLALVMVGLLNSSPQVEEASKL